MNIVFTENLLKSNLIIIELSTAKKSFRSFEHKFF